MHTPLLFTVCVLGWAGTAHGDGPTQDRPKYRLFLDENNVYDAADSKMSKGHVKYLGSFSSTQDCANACLSFTGGRCWSFTHHTPQFPGEFAAQCFGRIDDPLWSPTKEGNINSGVVEWPCRHDMDCSLNGMCANGTCQCDKAWFGHRCEFLALMPAERHSGYHYMEDGKNISSWGGPVVRYKDGSYHMYAAEMRNHCGINSWTLNSQIIHSVSSTPTGTYKRVGVVWQPFAHEPDVVVAPTGEFVMYWSANQYEMPLCVCEDGSTNPDCRTPGAATAFYQYMSVASHPDGPWSTPLTLFGGIRKGDTNFAPVIFANGSVVGFTRWGDWGNRGSLIHLVVASNWSDPATYMESKEELFPELPAAGTEDPFLYLDPKGRCHAIFHNMYPQNDQNVCGGHAFSEDCIHWVYGGAAFGNQIRFTDGGHFTYTRRERPHFVFAEDGVTPIALTNGAQYGGRYGDATYTLLQPIMH